MARLSERDKRFADEYLIDLNPVQASIRAGYSPATAKDAYRWLKENDDREKPGLRARIDAALAERSKRTGVTADRVVRELGRIAFGDLTDVVDVERATVKWNATRDDTAIIASVKVKSGEDFTEREVKGWDKLKALELLGRHLGMFADKLILTDDRPTIVDNIPGGEADG